MNPKYSRYNINALVSKQNFWNFVEFHESAKVRTWFISMCMECGLTLHFLALLLSFFTLPQWNYEIMKINLAITIFFGLVSFCMAQSHDSFNFETKSRCIVFQTQNILNLYQHCNLKQNIERQPKTSTIVSKNTILLNAHISFWCTRYHHL